MKEWFELNEKDRKSIIDQVSAKTGMIPATIEKD